MPIIMTRSNKLELYYNQINITNKEWLEKKTHEGSTVYSWNTSLL